MPIPSFTASINPFPSYPLTTAIAQVAADLAQWPGAMPNYVVVVDEQQRPLGAVAVGVLWAKAPTVPIAHAQGIRSSLASRDRTLGDYQPWLAAVVTIPMADAVAAGLDWLSMTGADPQACWVGVSATGQYQGLLNPGVVLAKILADGLPLRDAGAALRTRSTPSGAIPANSQPWVIGLSHTLKTPLTSLLGLSTLLLDHRVGSLNERQTRYALLMRRAIRQLIRLVNQWVDWVRLETNQMELNPGRVDLGPLAESLIPSFLTGWQADAASPPAWASSFAIALATDITTIWADRLRLQQSLHGVLDYLLQQGAEPQRLRIEPWGSWLGLTLEASTPEGALPGIGFSGPQDPGARSVGPNPGALLVSASRGELVGQWSQQYGYRLTLLLPLQAERAGKAPALGMAPLEASPFGADPFGADPRWTEDHEADPHQTEPDLPPAAAPGTTLILLVSSREFLIDQIYGHLQGSDYRLVVAPTWEDAHHLSQRLQPQAILLDGQGLPEPPLQSGPSLGFPEPTPPLIVVGTEPMAAIPTAKTIVPADLDNLQPYLDSLTGASRRVAAPHPAALARAFPRGYRPNGSMATGVAAPPLSALAGR